MYVCTKYPYDTPIHVQTPIQATYVVNTGEPNNCNNKPACIMYVQQMCILTFNLCGLGQWQVLHS